MNDDGTATPRNAAVPWDGKPERLDVFLLAAISLSGIYALALLPAVPSLVGTHPVLLELLRGSMTAMVTMGALSRVGDQSLFIAVVAALPGLMMFDWVYWWAGRRWGRRVMDLFLGSHPKAAQRTARLERLIARWGWVAIVIAYFQPVPNVLIYAAAGWTRMRLATFLLLDVIGSLLWVALCVGLGYAIGQRAVDVAKGVSHYALYLTILLVLVIFARQAWTATRGSSRSPRQG
ncbi:DedA family protein [Candidatus Solirubrobacter pratensis]|uniref:DedA family protein n=1 Tax=Candidatus Solirubrobacter pratensis TaxID=1298857 RepID=UPI0004125AE0|nr:DedA family protein [Candidatus Solirubrobacter pratensis]